MKQFICTLIALCLLLSVSAFAEEQSNRSLIVYFDYTENIVTDGLDVDALSTASMAPQFQGTHYRDRSNILVARDVVMERTGGDVYSIVIQEKYPAGYWNTAMPALQDKNNNKQFTLVNELPDMSLYDTVYINVPVWWVDAPPQPVLNFLQYTDLSGKQVVYIGMSEDVPLDGSLQRLRQLQPDAVLTGSLLISALTDNDTTAQQINDFLNNVGY